MLESRDQLPSFHQVSPYQKRISTGDNWKTFVLHVFGDRFEPWAIMLLPPGGFLALGVLLTFFAWMRTRPFARAGSGRTHGLGEGSGA